MLQHPRRADAGLPGHDAAAVAGRGLLLAHGAAGLPARTASWSTDMVLALVRERAGHARGQGLRPRGRGDRASSPRPTARCTDQKQWIFWRVSLFPPAIGFLTQLNLVVLLGYGGYLVIHGRLPLGSGPDRVRRPAAAVLRPGQQDHQHRQQRAAEPDRRPPRLRGARRAGRDRRARPTPCRLPQARGAVAFEHVSLRATTRASRVLRRRELRASSRASAWPSSAPPARARRTLLA